jgi:cell division protein FtsI (penicillin-binding protein 3)
VLLAGIGFWILVLVVRLVDLQVLRKDEFARRAKKQQERTVELAPFRGAIFDAGGKPLAVTVFADSVFAIPSDVEDPKRTARVLSPLLGLPARELERRLGNVERDFVWLARRVSEETAAAVSRARLPGVKLWKESARRYPEGTLAASVLGYVGTDNVGLAGLEYRYDAAVRGRPVRITLLRDAVQRHYAVRQPGRSADRGDASAGTEGSSLVLTLDASIQHVVEQEAEEARREHSAKSVSVVVLDPKTGAVLALATTPGFDPNRFGDVDAETRRCRPLADTFEPGSVFKAVTFAAALDAGVVAENDVIDCGNGALTIGSTTIHEHDRKAWSTLPLPEVMIHSSNIGSARIGLALGRRPFFESIRAFGFGQRTGIDLDGETGGLLADVSSWSALSLATMSFGQEIGVTVLQIARAYAALANGGLLPTPYLVSEIRRGDGDVRRITPRPPVRVVSPGTARTLRRLLAEVVTEGTGKLAAVPGYEAAGKTGTAQKATPGGGYAKDRHVASFVGFAPVEAPRLVVAVVVDEPKGTYYGGDVAAPVFSRVMAESLRLLGVPPALTGRPPAILTADLSAGARAGGPPGTLLIPAANRTGGGVARPAEGTVPDVSGLSARDAVRALARAGISARLSGRGFVVAQEPAAGTPAGRGDICLVALSPAASSGGSEESR